jgi:hypothetical protein
MPLDNDDIKQLIAILQKGLVEDNEPKEPSNKNKTNNISTKKTKSISQSNTENKFISMGFDSLHKEDVAIDKVLNKHPPTPRNRKFKQIDVKCRSCGKKETINSSLLYESPDRYKCNKCCSSPG